MYRINKLLWGLAFIIVGIIFATNALNITDINIFFDGWWTLFIIVPCFIGLFKNGGQITGNLIGLSIGLALLLSTREIIDFEIIASLIIPFIFIVIGLSIIFNNFLKSKITEKFIEADKDGLEPIVATFAEQKIDLDNEKFKDSKIDAIFGSVVLDLMKADLDKEVIIKSSSIFGGVKILVPNNVNVKVKPISIFGGVTNKISNKKDNKKTIFIESFCLFGGLEIK